MTASPPGETIPDKPIKRGQTMQQNTKRRFRISPEAIATIEAALTKNISVEVKREKNNAVVVRLDRQAISKTELIEEEQ